MRLFNQAIILNFDDSFKYDGIESADFKNGNEIYRYFSSFRKMETVSSLIRRKMSGKNIFFTGSGDFHHITYSILKTMKIPKIHVVVFDNHPDNMIFPSGIHCGSWVYHAAKLPFVSRISVIGITSNDISGINIVQNRYSFLRSGKVRYYCLRGIPRLTSSLSGGHVFDIRKHLNNIGDFIQKEILTDDPVYLSIDKDVISEKDAFSSWDQGVLSIEQLLSCVKVLAPQVIKTDICGDLSLYSFKNRFKKIMRFIDGGEKKSENIHAYRKIHSDINLKLLKVLESGKRK